MISSVPILIIKFISFSTNINYETLIYLVYKEAKIPVYEWYANADPIKSQLPSDYLYEKHT